MLELELQIHDRRTAADGIVELDLREPSGASLPPFEAGSHIDVLAGEGLVRQYSLCNDPAETHRYLLGVLLDPQSRGGSTAVHQWQRGARVQVGLPRNNFRLHDGPAVLVAGGIGITPMKAMSHALLRRGADFRLHYFSRSRSKAAFLEELQTAMGESRVIGHFDDEGAALPLPSSQLRPPAGGHLYICGPTGFIGRVRQDALTIGVPAESIHTEHFSAPATIADGAQEFTVEATRSGIRVTVKKDETIAQALQNAGVQVLTSCEQGLCGACLTPVLAGIPDHRDDFQTEDEKASNERMTICCSRSLSPILSLDL